ncbi:MAG: hypothetical protein RIC56_10795 [Pseudomonadales bacterium]
MLVLALGGNALSPPGHADLDYAAERSIVAQTGRALTQLASRQYRLIIVHGNGPQVGRLLRSDPDVDPAAQSNLDIRVAQTQGELGYLLMKAIDAPVACLVTRVLVGDDPGPPLKPIGPILRSLTDHRTAVTQVAGGWRQIVSSPRPIDILETDAIAALLPTHHVIVGGGGGVPLTADGTPISAVVDKDWVASLLAVALDAQHLVFATDVDGVFEGFGEASARPLDRLSLDHGRRMLRAGSLGAGSMAPKVESALDYVAATGRTARICALRDIRGALAGGDAGTVVG